MPQFGYTHFDAATVNVIFDDLSDSVATGPDL
jgi:hypothetical protein